MTTHIDTCVAAAEAAGWDGKALFQLVMDPRSATLPGFKSQLANANEIRGLLKISGPSMQFLGYDVDAALQDFVAKGVSIDTVRVDTLRTMAEADDRTQINTARSLIVTADPYKARSAEIDAHKERSRG